MIINSPRSFVLMRCTAKNGAFAAQLPRSLECVRMLPDYRIPYDMKTDRKQEVFTDHASNR